MTKIKILSMFLIFVLSLFFISTIKTYAGAGTNIGIIVCNAKLKVLKADIINESGGCATDVNCEIGDRCVECLADCADAGFRTIVRQSSSGGNIVYTLYGDEPL